MPAAAYITKKSNATSRVNASRIRAPCAFPRSTPAKRRSALLQQDAVVECARGVDDSPQRRQRADDLAENRVHLRRIAAVGQPHEHRRAERFAVADHLTRGFVGRTASGQNDVAGAETNQPACGVQAECSEAAGDPVGRRRRAPAVPGPPRRRPCVARAAPACPRGAPAPSGGTRRRPAGTRTSAPAAAAANRQTSRRAVRQAADAGASDRRAPPGRGRRRSSVHRDGRCRNSSAVHTPRLPSSRKQPCSASASTLAGMKSPASEFRTTSTPLPAVISRMLAANSVDRESNTCDDAERAQQRTFRR